MHLPTGGPEDYALVIAVPVHDTDLGDPAAERRILAAVATQAAAALRTVHLADDLIPHVERDATVLTGEQR